MKLILLEWQGYDREYRSLRFFEYNGVTYPPGRRVPWFVVIMLKSEQEEKREMIKALEESLKHET